MSLLDALYRFRNEIKDLNISSSERIKLMEDFKQAFNRSLDYDLAFNRVAPQLMPELKSMTFKSFWKSYNSKEFSKFLGTEEKKARRIIDEEFARGEREVNIINDLLMEAQDQLGRPLTQGEIDKLRYLVIDEKVKLRRNNMPIKD